MTEPVQLTFDFPIYIECFFAEQIKTEIDLNILQQLWEMSGKSANEIVDLRASYVKQRDDIFANIRVEL